MPNAMGEKMFTVLGLIFEAHDVYSSKLAMEIIFDIISPFFIAGCTGVRKGCNISIGSIAGGGFQRTR